MPDFPQQVIQDEARYGADALVRQDPRIFPARASRSEGTPRTTKAGEFFGSLRMTIARAASLPARGAGAVVWIYQKTLSPALAAVNPSGGCRFAPTCSHYAREALQTHGVLAGFVLTVRRLVKCGPWHPGGLDPVPPRRAPICTRVTATPSPNARSRPFAQFHG